LAKTPSFTVAAALTIALGVGANTAVFSLIDTVLLRSLPVQDPSGLVFVRASGTTRTPGAPPYPVFARLRERTSAFAAMAAFATDEIRIEIDGQPEPVNGQIASGDYFSVLGVNPLLGRLTERRDEMLDPPVAVISHRYWRRRFGGDPTVLGKTFSSGDRTFTIVGVTPVGFEGLRPGFAVDMTLPISRDIGDLGGHAIVARLKPGTTDAQAQAESASVLRAALSEAGFPRNLIEQRFRRVELRSAGRGEDTLRGRFTKPLYALVGIAALLLLLATANIANLLLARGFTRRREFAIRLATGAGRMRLARQLVTETLLLFACGAVPGIVLARLGVTLIESMFAEGRRSITITADLNWRVLGFAIAVTLGAGLLSALFPAWRVFRSELEQVIREGQTRSGESRASSMLRQSLVASQVALSLVLLVGAITFSGTLAKLRDLDPGFRNDRVLTMSVELPDGYLTAGKSAAVWSGVAGAVRTIPNVKSASLATFTPLSQRDRWRPPKFADTCPRAGRTPSSISITSPKDTSRPSESRRSKAACSLFRTRRARRESR
jgi:predicted permease